MELPPSVLVKHQTKTFTKIIGNEKLVVTIWYDDSCNNKHNSFAITAELWERESVHTRFYPHSYGCQHEEVVKFFPEFEPLLKWHLCASDGPMHYIGNTMYFAGDRDCWGLRKDESRQLKNGGTGLPAWQLVAISAHNNEIELHKLNKYIDSKTQPECQYTIEYRPWCRIGEGKEHELGAARRAAIWPEATLEQLQDRDQLEARLPALMQEFRAMIEGLGMVF